MLVAPWGGAGDPCLAARNAVQTTSLASVRSMSPQKSPTRQRRPHMLFPAPEAFATGFECTPPTWNLLLPDASAMKVAAADCRSLSQSPPTSPTKGRQTTPGRWPPTPLTSCIGGKETPVTPSASSTGQLASARCTTYPYPTRGQTGLADAQRAATHREHPAEQLPGQIQQRDQKQLPVPCQCNHVSALAQVRHDVTATDIRDLCMAVQPLCRIFKDSLQLIV